MTVCVAAVAEKNTLIGASDRMFTAGDIEFETEQSKIWLLSKSMCALVAGDAGLQTEILKQVHKIVSDWISKEPKAWVKVKDVVEIYCKEYRKLLREKAEARILGPHGLDLNSFLATQASMAPEVVNDLADRLSSFQFDSPLATIIMGVDTDGPVNQVTGETLVYPQLYAIEEDSSANLTSAGFAAIGIGKSHAESQFMLAGHSPMRSVSDTALLVYTAKKRAEVAPGVGKETDMVSMGPGLGTFFKVEDKHIAFFDSVYQKIKKSNGRILAKAQSETKRYISDAQIEYQKLLQSQQQQTKEGDVKPLVDQKSAGQQ